MYLTHVCVCARARLIEARTKPLSKATMKIYSKARGRSDNKVSLTLTRLDVGERKKGKGYNLPRPAKFSPYSSFFFRSLSSSISFNSTYSQSNYYSYLSSSNSSSFSSSSSYFYSAPSFFPHFSSLLLLLLFLSFLFLLCSPLLRL